MIRTLYTIILVIALCIVNARATEVPGLVNATLLVSPDQVVATGLEKVHGSAVLTVTTESGYLKDVKLVPKGDTLYIPLERKTPCDKDASAFRTWPWSVVPDHPNRNVEASVSGKIGCLSGGSGGAEKPTFVAEVVHIDLDVDSDNDSDPIAGQKFPSRTAGEDELEWPTEVDLPGLVLITNRGFEEGGYTDPNNPTQDKDKAGIFADDQDLSRGVLEVKGKKSGSARLYGDDSLARLYIRRSSSSSSSSSNSSSSESDDWKHWKAGSSETLKPDTYELRLEGISAGLLTMHISFTPDDLSYGGTTADDKIRVTVIDPHYQVDRSRDAERKVTDVGLDLTYTDHEMRFWLNNGNNAAEFAKDPTSQNDGDERRIKNRRVLDNFERMRIVADGCGIEIAADTVRLYPRWVTMPDPKNNMRLSLFPNEEDPGLGINYLIDELVAQKLVRKERLTASNSIDAINERLLPNKQLKQFVSGDNLRYPAVWCVTGGLKGGWTAGGDLIREKTRLGMVVHWNIQGTWRKAAWYRHLHLSLSDVRASIVHWSAGDTETDSGSFPTPKLEIMKDAQPPGDRFYGVQDPDVVSTLEKHESGLLFVHGYRMPTWERRDFPNTHFKRLYWHRYGGSMGMFSWPTEYWANPYVGGIIAPQNYDRSEFQARRSGAMVLSGAFPAIQEGLGVNIQNFSVMAHSMGNVVLSEAMRASQGRLAQKYFAMMSAESAGAYRYGAPTIGRYNPVLIFPNNRDGVGPDVYRHANPQSPRSRIGWDEFNANAPFEPLSKTLDGPVYYSGGFARSFAESRTYFRDNEAATANSWVGTQNTKPDNGFLYQRVLEPSVIQQANPENEPIYRDLFEQRHYQVEPFKSWPLGPTSSWLRKKYREFSWRFAPLGGDQITQNAAVMAFVIGSPTTAVGSTGDLDTPTANYPHAECLFSPRLSINIGVVFKVGVGEYDHSYLWNYWSAKTWEFHSALLRDMP